MCIRDSEHPYQELTVIKKYTNGNTLEKLKWGMIPSWSKKKDFKPFKLNLSGKFFFNISIYIKELKRVVLILHYFLIKYTITKF